MNWIFKTENVIFSQNFEIATISIVKRRNFTGKEGELVVILDNKGRDWKFISLYEIRNVSVEVTETKWRAIFIELALVKKYEQEKLLTDYIYSFKRITNFNNPYVHFSRQYNRLSNFDLDVIDNDRIYYTRTILGTIFNSLHKDHQEQYLFYLAVQNPSLLIDTSDLVSNLKLLAEYVKFAILKPAKYLSESDKILSNLVKQYELNQIAFVDSELENMENTESIHRQSLLINNFLPQITGDREIEINTEQFIYDENNERFSEIFKNSLLPFKLK